MSEQKIEQEIQDKGLNAPRLTPALIDAKIKSFDFHVFPHSCLTVCCMTLVNGFTVTGESACASPENFDAEIGQKIAHEQARNKIWMLEGYLLKQGLFFDSYLRNCEIIRGGGDDATLFTQDGQVVYARLDGYVVVPKEVYYKDKQSNK